MKYKVVKEFTDKYTREKYNVGRILELSEERATEILSVDKLIVKINSKKKK